jgi:hypothetical protein
MLPCPLGSDNYQLLFFPLVWKKKIFVEIKTTLFLESYVHLIDIGLVGELSRAKLTGWSSPKITRPIALAQDPATAPPGARARAVRLTSRASVAATQSGWPPPPGGCAGDAADADVDTGAAARRDAGAAARRASSAAAEVSSAGRRGGRSEAHTASGGGASSDERRRLETAIKSTAVPTR